MLILGQINAPKRECQILRQTDIFALDIVVESFEQVIAGAGLLSAAVRNSRLIIESKSSFWLPTIRSKSVRAEYPNLLTSHTSVSIVGKVVHKYYYVE
jgi:hypothetical protein